MVRPAIAGHFVIGPLCACWPTMVPRQGEIELTGCTKAISPGNDPELGARSLEGLACDAGAPRARSPARYAAGGGGGGFGGLGGGGFGGFGGSMEATHSRLWPAWRRRQPILHRPVACGTG